ncbi:DUF1837 domain-containing protein [Shewanella sp. SM23]|uniref:DUF1837 domain-containing protein n=1 Tax=Shewanella sp. SM23 TaxID=2912794 RepID=UPI0021D9FF6B|nr:DUF1837 domain-containing protein [Shewanella sp. SM23]MCU8082944.1 DUF1837 domain-containing protein [Shewanella sp. SM23]
MRNSLKNLIKKTLIYKYTLPNVLLDIDGMSLSNVEDDCFSCECETALAEIIYNSVIEYSFNQFDLTDKDYKSMYARALKSKIRFNPDASDTTKISYGFFGEVLLYCFLAHYYYADPIIARGYFYSPVDKKETAGYDSYHLVDSGNSIHLWFGEVKFRDSLSSCVHSAIKGLDKVISDDYLSSNVINLEDRLEQFNIKGSKLEKVITDWQDNPEINIPKELAKHNISLTYPILLVYPDKTNDYDIQIKKSVKFINDKYSKQKFNLSINYELFFILLPLSEVKKIKQDVISWIELKKPLL